MADLSKLLVDGVTYDISDTVARTSIANIAAGLTHGYSFDTTKALVDALNAANNMKYRVGDELFVLTKMAADYWVSKVNETSTTYTYTAGDIPEGTQIGYYTVYQTGRDIDLTPYATKTELNAVKSTAEGALQRSGGTMTGDLTLKGAPTTDNMASNKKYVDDKVAAIVIPTKLPNPFALTVGTKSYDGSEAVSIVKADIGLGNVDNTSDTNKPISKAVQDALDKKANDVVFTGATTAAGAKGLVPAPAIGDKDKYLAGNGSWKALPTMPVYELKAVYTEAEKLLALSVGTK